MGIVEFLFLFSEMLTFDHGWHVLEMDHFRSSHRDLQKFRHADMSSLFATRVVVFFWPPERLQLILL